jgi:hypothetical protein
MGRTLGAYLLCTLGGIGMGFYLANNKLQEKYYEGYNAGYEEAKERYQDAAKVVEEALIEQAAENLADDYRPENKGENEYPEPEKQASSVPASEESPLGKVTVPAQAVNYNRISTDAQPPADEVIIEQEDETPEPADIPQEENLDTPHGPYEIDADDYDVNHFGYDQVSYNYWAGCESVSDEDDEVLPKSQVNEEIGRGNLAKLDDDKRRIYVRNDEKRMDYEIDLNHGTYQDTIGRRRQSVG